MAAPSRIQLRDVDGVKVVSDGKVLTLDREDALARLQEAQQRMIDGVPSRDHAGRTAAQIAPLSLPLA